MKKILIASTALIATAGVAAAEVDFKGSARFGAKFTGEAKVGNVVTAKSKTETTSRFNLDIVGTKETDSGLKFGTKIRLRGNAKGKTQEAVTTNGAQFTVSTGGLTVGVGNVSGAIDSMNGLYANEIGLTAFQGMYSTHGLSYQGYTSQGVDTSTGVSVSYSAGDFGVMASMHTSGAETFNAINGKYTFSGWTVSLGFQDVSTSSKLKADKAAADAKDLTALTVTGNVGIADVSALVSNRKAGTGLGLGATFEVGAATKVTAVMSTFNPSAAGAKNSTSFGLGVAHDLGGATLKAGVGSMKTGNNSAQVTADLGLSFKF